MKTVSLKTLSIFVLVALLATAWGQAVPTAASEEEVVLTIGFTASVTGNLNVESKRQENGLKPWVDQRNAGGGIKIGNGTIVKFKAVSYDDESTKERVQELYARLATEDKADFLISPYSSGLADAAAVIAEQNGKIMITTGAASDSTYKKGYTLVYQTYTPASRYLTGAVDNLAQLDPAARKVAFVHENDKFSTDVVTAAKDYAGTKGYQIVLFEGYDTGTADFGPFINKIQAAAPEAIMGGGHFQDGSTFARQLFEKNISVKYLALLVAPPEPKFMELGDAALGVVGPSQWEPRTGYSPESAKAEGLVWFGPGGDEFVNAYTAAYNEEPSYHSAGGYAAGLILEKALMDAGATDTQSVKVALDKMDILTFYGRIKFDTSAEAHGLQVGHSMVYIQWQKDASGALVKQIVWPLEGATAKTLYPIR
jgi:ABC-type branched-subunit amino acid transport system substrate-binding protein